MVKELFIYFIVNLLVAACYAYLSHKIGGPAYDPIGTGLRFWFFALIHFFAIFVIAFTGVVKGKRSRFLVSNLFFFVLIVAILVHYEGPLNDFFLDDPGTGYAGSMLYDCAVYGAGVLEGAVV
ncbi:hypothetical protein [Niabella drilacis]|uniref:Uncharacterized protein n=1 Tax=Niabella drilacis (strain DSM 25811 / CCM 8410 / CCUG 62505 / LMG 26954 / E90) TaxID=1285928 RepID=A0A1G6KP81_NIADE|nr:hypothetical protein [Niabella drilacis]SDC32631.1 hypothetical protein SAMN04487894_10245 [Niabella drilacis]